MSSVKRLYEAELARRDLLIELCADICRAHSLVVSLRKGFGEMSPELRNLLTQLRAKELDTCRLV